MNILRAIVVGLLVVLGLSGCAAHQPFTGGGSHYGGYRQGGYLVPRTPVGYTNPYTPYMGMHRGRCYYHGFVQSTNELCQNGTIQTPMDVDNSVQQPQSYGSSMQAVAAPVSGMSPETARMRLDELEAGGNPCTAKERTMSTSIGAVIGGLAGAVLARDAKRGLVAGALIGAAGGNGVSASDCQAYTNTRRRLLAVLDQYGCSGQVRRTNGVVTDDEICNFRRTYVPSHAAPQIADRDRVVSNTKPPPVREAMPPK